MLTTFLAGENAERAGRMSAADRRAAVLEGMAKYVGPAALEPVDFIETDWSGQEWTRGAYGTSFGPGGLTRFGEDIRRPVGPIHWACTDIAGVGHIHMEGAMRSGQRAAQRLPGGRPGLASLALVVRCGPASNARRSTGGWRRAHAPPL